jgi:hypothetical protein
MDKLKENERAELLARRMHSYNSVITDIYEKLVDREFSSVEKDVKFIIMEMRCILKSMEEDDF